MPNLRWYINRIQTMSIREIGFRIDRAAHNKLEQAGMGLIGKSPRTVPIEVGDLHQCFSAAADVDGEEYITAAERILSGRLSIFGMPNHEFGADIEWNRDPMTGIVAPLSFGKTLDYRNSRIVGDIKYLWEPNRHIHLVAVAQAYALNSEDRYIDYIVRSIQSWMKQCPYPRGPNWCSSLELAIRLINWMLVWCIVGGRNTFSKGNNRTRFIDDWLDCIYKHCHFITTHYSRYSSAGNHLIGEAAGLYCATSIWDFWPKSKAWKESAKDILIAESIRQTTGDGVIREQAISYQQFILDFLIISGLVGKYQQAGFPAEYWERVHALIRFIAAITDVGKNVPMLGDADDGYVFRLSPEPDFCPYQSLIATGASLFKDPYLKSKVGKFDDKSRWLLGKRGLIEYRRLAASEMKEQLLSFPEGGYYVLGSEIGTREEIRVLVDAGPLGLDGNAGHGHADALSLMLSVSGYEIFIDPGTYSYHTKQKMRDYFRGTSAHNTARIDRKDQAVSGGNFMWVKRYTAKCLSRTSDPLREVIVAQHDGYRRFTDPVVHRREVCLEKNNNRIYVTDTIVSQSTHSVELFWHIAEKCVVRRDDRVIHISNDKVRVLLKCLEQSAEIEMHRGNAEIPLGWVSRSFDVKTPITTVVFKLTAGCGKSIRTEISIDR